MLRKRGQIGGCKVRARHDGDSLHLFDVLLEIGGVENCIVTSPISGVVQERWQTGRERKYFTKLTVSLFLVSSSVTFLNTYFSPYNNLYCNISLKLEKNCKRHQFIEVVRDHGREVIMP